MDSAGGFSVFYRIQNELEYMGIDSSQAMAFGDNDNDIGLLLAAGESYAVETAPEEVKRSAGNSCPGWKDKGVYQIIKSKILS